MNIMQLIIGMGVVLIGTTQISSAATGQDAHSQHGAHPAGAQERMFQAEVSVPDDIKPGGPFTIDIQIRDDRGRKVAAFDIFQEKLMHLILVSDDLDFFGHLHPEHRGGGRFQTNAILPSAGGYTLFADYMPAGEKEQLSLLRLRMKGAKRSSGVPDARITEKLVQDTRVRMSISPATIKANEEVVIAFDLTQTDGRPVKGLGRYLGEKGHLVVIRKSAFLTGKDYVHTHAMKDGKAAEIRFMSRFPDKGLYKLWCQFNSSGTILTADFWIRIER
jgi:hypothetical protein